MSQALSHVIKSQREDDLCLLHLLLVLVILGTDETRSLSESSSTEKQRLFDAPCRFMQMNANEQKKDRVVCETR